MKHNKINPFLVKKGFYVSSMHWGDLPGDGFKLISSDVVAGPFKTAERAHEVMEKSDHIGKLVLDIKGEQA